VDIPLCFFKVAAFLHHGELAATGYVVEQTPQLDDLPEIPGPGVTDESRQDRGLLEQLHARFALDTAALHGVP
jgi:hypothetical protein